MKITLEDQTRLFSPYWFTLAT